MRRRLVGLALALELLVGCSSGEVQIAKGAVRQAGSTVGNDTVTVIKLSGDDIGRLADEAGVSENAIRSTAPELDDWNLWSSSMDSLTEIYNDTPGEIRSNLVDLACDGVRGEITSEDELNQNIAERFASYTPSQQQALANSVRGLWQDLYEARSSGNPDLVSAAVLTCFTVEQLVG